jgi:DNA-binding XRE family transcriptional regulator
MGTQKENYRDSVGKGRAFVGSEQQRAFAKDRYRGEGNPHAKLTLAQVHDIKQRYAAGGVSQQVLADEYGVRQTTISIIVRGKKWKDA